MNISKTRRKEIESIRENEIDYSDISELDDSFYRDARLVLPDEVDEEIVHWFKKHYGKDYLSQISTVLRQYMDTHS